MTKTVVLLLIVGAAAATAVPAQAHVAPGLRVVFQGQVTWTDENQYVRGKLRVTNNRQVTASRVRDGIQCRIAVLDRSKRDITMGRAVQQWDAYGVVPRGSARTLSFGLAWQWGYEADSLRLTHCHSGWLGI